MLLDGQKIQTLRKKAGYKSQKELAKALNVPPQMVGQIEKGDFRNWKISTLRHLSILLDVKIKALCCPKEYKRRIDKLCEKNLIVDGEKIRQLRKKKGYRTQQELAGSVGVSRQTIIRLEKGETKSCGLWTIQRLAEVLGLKSKALYCPGEQEPLIFSPDELELVKAYRTLSIRQRAVLFLKVVTLGEDPESLHIS